MAAAEFDIRREIEMDFSDKDRVSEHSEVKAGADIKTDIRTDTEADAISEGLSVEDAFAQLQEILDRMDAEGVSLEESFRCYERGMKLIRYCNDTIDRVEKKVRVLSAEGGSDEL